MAVARPSVAGLANVHAHATDTGPGLSKAIDQNGPVPMLAHFKRQPSEAKRPKVLTANNDHLSAPDPYNDRGAPD
jgi:hypothetical protein